MLCGKWGKNCATEKHTFLLIAGSALPDQCSFNLNKRLRATFGTVRYLFMLPCVPKDKANFRRLSLGRKTSCLRTRQSTRKPIRTQNDVHARVGRGICRSILIDHCLGSHRHQAGPASPAPHCKQSSQAHIAHCELLSRKAEKICLIFWDTRYAAKFPHHHY